MPIYSQLPNLNGNLLCAIDVETTGRDPCRHEICQIAIVPLGPDIKPLPDVRPFYHNLAPTRLECIDRGSLKVNGLSLEELVAFGLEQFRAIDMLEEWFQGLQLPFNRGLTPMAHNWSYEKGFLTQWLGLEGMDHFFTYQSRDTMRTATFLNDVAAFRGEQVPFKSVSLHGLCDVLGVVNEKEHDALSDCRATAEVYRRILTLYSQVPVDV